MEVYFYNSQRNDAGGVYIKFNSPPQYRILYCNTSWTNFPTDLPTATDKVWRVTLTRTSGIRLVIHCNEVEVLNILTSESSCSYSDWSKHWSRKVAKIYFNTDNDTASDYYRAVRGN